MRLTLIVVLLSAGLAGGAPASPGPDRVQTLLEQVRAHPDDLKARLGLSEEYRRLGGVENRRAAQRNYEEALHRRPDDITLLLAYGQLRVEQSFLSQGRRILARVAALDPGSVDAHFGLARLALRDYARYLDRHELETSSAELDRVLKLAPDHRDALYFSVFARMQGGDSTGARREAARLVAAHPRDAWGYLLMAALSVQLARFQEADWAARQGLALLRDPAEREAFETLRCVDRAAEAGRVAKGGAARDRFLLDFWKRRDPTPPTEINERRLEHIRRVVTAELYYGMHEKGIHGWDTAPGEAIIRYGVPVERRLLVPDGLEPTSMAQIHQVHGELTAFTFQDRLLSGRWMQPYNAGLPTVLDAAMTREEESYDVPMAGPPIPYAVALAQFKDRPSGTRIEMTLAAPVTDQLGWRLQHDEALFDRNWDYLGYQVGFLDRSVRTVDRRRPGGSYLVDLMPMRVRAGTDSVWIGSQLYDRDSHGYGGQLLPVAVRQFPDTALCLSDVMLLDRAGFDRAEGRFARPGGWGIPNPVGAYWAGENVPVYFEAYNLAPGPRGVADYTLQIQVDDAAPPNPRMLRPALIDLKPPIGPHVLARFDEAVAGRDLHRLLDVVVGVLDPGRYRLTLTVVDHQSGRSASSTALFRVVPAPDMTRLERP